jgi:hypothetical protein
MGIFSTLAGIFNSHEPKFNECIDFATSAVRKDMNECDDEIVYEEIDEFNDQYKEFLFESSQTDILENAVAQIVNAEEECLKTDVADEYESIPIPTMLDRQYEDEDDAYSHFQDYARQNGFFFIKGSKKTTKTKGCSSVIVLAKQTRMQSEPVRTIVLFAFGLRERLKYVSNYQMHIKS